MTTEQLQRVLGIYQQNLANEQMKSATLQAQLDEALAELDAVRAGVAEKVPAVPDTKKK